MALQDGMDEKITLRDAQDGMDFWPVVSWGFSLGQLTSEGSLACVPAYTSNTSPAKRNSTTVMIRIQWGSE